MISFFGLWSQKMIAINLSLSIIGGFFAMAKGQVMAHESQFMVITALVLADFFSGIMKAIKLEEFETRKALKVVWYLSGYWMVFLIIYLTEKAFPALSILDEMVLLPIVIFTIVSTLKNLHLAGLIEGELIARMLKSIDHYKTNNNGKRSRKS